MPVRIHDRSLSHDRRSLDSGIVLPQNLLTSPGTLYEDFETVGDWTVANGSAAANVTQFKTGTQSIKLTTNAGATATMTKTVNWDLSGDWGGLSFWVYLHDAIADYSAAQNLWLIQLSNNSGLTNTMRQWYFYNQFWGGTGWHRFYIPKNYFGVQGSGTFSSPIIRIRFTVYAAATKTPSMSFDNLEIGEKHIPAILFRFDDGSDVHYSAAYNYMKQYRIPGTAYINSAEVGNPTYVSWGQLLEMNTAGWAIANHTRSHTPLKGLSVADQQTAISDGATDLAAQGLGRCAQYLAYPGGGISPGFDDNTFVAMTNISTVSGHTTLVSLNPTSGTPCQGYYLLTLPDYTYGDMFHVLDVGFSSAVSLAQGETALDLTMAAGGILCPLLHRLDSAGQWTSSDLRTFVDYVRTKALAGLIYPITIDDLYKLTLGPVRVPKVR